MKQFLKETAARIGSQTPVYFKKVINGSAGLIAGGTSMVAIPSMMPTTAHVHIPDIVSTIGAYMIAVGLGAGAVAKVTKTDPPPDPPKQ